MSEENFSEQIWVLRIEFQQIDPSNGLRTGMSMGKDVYIFSSAGPDNVSDLAKELATVLNPWLQSRAASQSEEPIAEAS